MAFDDEKILQDYLARLLEMQDERDEWLSADDLHAAARDLGLSDEDLARVEASIARQLEAMPRRAIIEQSLGARGALVRVADLDEAAAIANRIAPEHLELSLDDAENFARSIRHAGAIFLGRHTAEAIGDYCAGPNHVLPTSRTARFSSPLGVYDFQKRSSLIGCSAAGADSLGRVAATLARGEGLIAHARSAEYRVDKSES